MTGNMHTVEGSQLPLRQKVHGRRRRSEEPRGPTLDATGELARPEGAAGRRDARRRLHSNDYRAGGPIDGVASVHSFGNCLLHDLNELFLLLRGELLIEIVA